MRTFLETWSSIMGIGKGVTVSVAIGVSVGVDLIVSDSSLID